MLSNFLVIQDSEDESSDNNANYQDNGMNPPPPQVALTESSSYLQSPSLSLGPGQISGEARDKAIKEAQSLLLAPTPDTPKTPEVQSELVKVATAARSKTSNGRLEGSISREINVYDFPVDDEDDEDFEPPGGKKRKRPTKKAKSVTEVGEGLPFEDKKAKSRKKRESSATVRGSKSIPDMLQDEYSEDDWAPNSKIEKPAGKKSTRSNTNEKELAPLLPKPKRKPKGGIPVGSNQFDGDLSLGIDISRVIEQSEESPTVQTSGNEPNFNNFMIDLTSEELILAAQKKAGYEALSLGATESSDATLLPVNFRGRGSDTEDYQALSTIPDPPSEGLGQDQLWGLEHNESLAMLPPHQLLPPQSPLLPGNQRTCMESSPLSSPPMEGSSTGRSLSAALVETSKEGRKGDNSKIAKSKKAAKRSFTDGSIDTEGFGRVASEWRAAKGRSKTMHDVITLSDNESHFAQEIPEKKKKAVRQKKSATVGEGAKKGAKGGAAAAKKGKGKGKGKAVVNDSEDDGAFSDEGSVQHPISNPNDATTDEVVALDSKQTPGRKPTSNQVMIAVAIESPPKSAQKRKSTAGKAEEVGPPGDTMESNFDLVYENPQHDYESAPPSPEPVVPAKRAASGASVGGRKKKTREELEDEDDNWDEKPKKATKKAGVKGKNTKVLDVAAEAVAVIEDEAEIEVPPLKSAAKGRAAKGGKTAAAKAKAAKNLSAEEEVVEQKPEEAEETPGAGRRASALKTEDKKEALAPAEPQADIQPTKAETETTPAPPERKSATPASTSKITSTPTPGRVPFRVGLSRNSRIPSLLKGFRK